MTETTKIKRPAKCDDCGKDYADTPHNLCPGCRAYREHQQ